MCQRAFNLAAPSISSSKKEGRSFGAVVVVAFVVTFPIVVILDTVVVALETVVVVLETVVVVLETVVVVVLETVVAGQSVVGTVGCDTPDGDGAPHVDTKIEQTLSTAAEPADVSISVVLQTVQFVHDN